MTPETAPILPKTTGWFCPKCSSDNELSFKFCFMCRQPNPYLVVSAPLQPVQQIVITDLPKSKAVYVILGLLFGFLGIHNFYAGRHSEGAFQLLCFCFLFWTLLVPIGLFIWSVFEVIAVKKDGRGRLMR